MNNGYIRHGYDGYEEHHRHGVRELLSDHKHTCGDHHHGHHCHVNRIYRLNSFKIGDPIHYNKTSGLYEIAVEGNCDFIVVGVDSLGTWFEPASTGVYDIKLPNLMGSVYLSSDSRLTNEITTQKLGFIDNGIIFLNVGSIGISPTPPTPSNNGVLDFNNPVNSGYVALLSGGY